MYSSADRFDRLTKLAKRQMEVLQLYCRRYTYSEIGQQLGISKSTVQYHLGRVIEKLEIYELPEDKLKEELESFCIILREGVGPGVLPAPQVDDEDIAPSAGALAKVERIEPPAPIVIQGTEIQPYPERVPVPTIGRGIPLWLLFIGIVLGAILGAGGVAYVASRTQATNIAGRSPLEATITAQAVQLEILTTQQAGVKAAETVATTVSTPPRPSLAITAVSTNAPVVTPTATVVPTATPQSRTSAGSVLRFGETWVGDGLYLTAKNAPDRGAFDSTVVGFSVENRTGQTLNFGVLGTIFSLSTNTNKFYAGHDDKFALNDFLTGTKRDFTVSFNVSWPDLQAVKRDPQVSWLLVEVKDFNSRLGQAQWRDEVIH